MTVSFDFDGTLDRSEFHYIVKLLAEMEHRIVITTKRYEKRYAENLELYQVCDRIGIYAEDIRFTNGDAKYKRMKGINIHIDNDNIEIASINRITECKGIWIHQWTQPEDLKNKIFKHI